MNKKVSDVFFIKKGSDGSIKISLPPLMTAGQNEEHQSAELKPNVTTIADCLSPLLTSMNLFGLYFKSERCEMSEGKWLRRRRNLSVIHSAVLAVLMWINVVRMFSVFAAEEEFGELIFFKLICSLRRH